MRKPQPTTQTMTVSEVKNKLPTLVAAVARNETRILVEQDGGTVAALVSAEDLEQLARLDAQRTERRQVVDAMREPFRGVPAEEIERETAKAVAEVLQEMRREREAATTKR